MNQFVSSFSTFVVGITLRAGSYLLGTSLAALLPVQIWSDRRQAANIAAGHMPNMDPGTVVALAAVMAVGPLLAVLIIEAVRCWGTGSRPLPLPACAALAALASWPVSATFTVESLHFSYPGVLVESTLGVVAFYYVRWRFYPDHDPRVPTGLPRRR